MDSSTKGLQDISFGGWEVVPDHVVKMMEAKNQYFAPSTLLGVNGLAWISPSENIGGNIFQYRGFMYKFCDATKAIIMHVSKVAEVQKKGSPVACAKP